MIHVTLQIPGKPAKSSAASSEHEVMTECCKSSPNTHVSKDTHVSASFLTQTITLHSYCF